MCALGGMEQAYLYTASPNVVPAFGTCSHLIGLQPDEPDAVPLEHQCDHGSEWVRWSIGAGVRRCCSVGRLPRDTPKYASYCVGVAGKRVASIASKTLSLVMLLD